MTAAFGNFYSGKRVMVTGHTGFKGSWLSLWLRELGSEVVGFSLQPPSTPSHFEACGMSERVLDIRGDILHYEHLLAAVREQRPEIIFHLAAQPLVREAYEHPRHTFHVNVMGTTNILDVALHTDSVSLVIVVTSDKVYRNEEWDWAYRENDSLGGYEPYGVSKACAEFVVGVYQDRRFQRVVNSQRELSIASVRAGNVLGGGDWARHRVIPDLVRALTSETEMVIRQPQATRPWQHVLDALSGYLCLGPKLAHDPTRFATAWNFGPADQKGRSVEQIVRAFLERWPAPASIVRIEPAAAGEHRTLQVDSSKAREQLGWQPAWDIDQTLEATVDWYRYFHQSQGHQLAEKSCEQIRAYSAAARQAGIPWAPHRIADEAAS